MHVNNKLFNFDIFFQKKTKLVRNDFQVPLGSEEPKKVEEIEVLAESLTQQPNLSQG